MKVHLSAVIITFNEESNIGRCLKSLAGVADEIVVVDSYSTDRTKEICLSYGVKFLENPFQGMIEQKQFALNQVSYQHVLSLDADEALSPELERAVLAVKSNWRADAYSMNRLTNYCGNWIRHSGWYPDRKVRLFDKDKVSWGGKNPHDKVMVREGAKQEHLSGDLLHYSYHSLKQHLDQVNIFTDVALKEMIQHNKRVSVPLLLVKPPFKFIKMYLLQLGFLDGFAGFCIAVVSSYAVFAKYAKLYLHNKSTTK